MRIAICDDEQTEIEILQNLILEVFDNTKPLEILTFTDGDSFIQTAGEVPAFDLVFLDIYLTEFSEMDGIQIGRQLKARFPETHIVFVTMSSDFAVQAFQIDALYYIVKPIQRRELEKVFKRFSRREPKTYIIFETVGNEQIKLCKDDIAFLESSNNYTLIHTVEEQYRIKSPLYKQEQRLGEDFLKLGRGLVVNMKFIRHMKKDICILEDGREILLSRRTKTEIREKYREYLFNEAKLQAERGTL